MRISFTEDEVYDAIGQLRSKMSDTTGIFTEHPKFSRSVIALPLSLFFTPIVRHGHMPQLIRDSTLVPIPRLPLSVLTTVLLLFPPC